MIDGAFGLPGPDDDAAAFGPERENMARPDQVRRLGIVGDGRQDGPRAVLGRSPGRYAAAGVDRYREPGLKGRRVVYDHQGQVDGFHLFPGHGKANESASVCRHEIDDLGGYFSAATVRSPSFSRSSSSTSMTMRPSAMSFTACFDRNDWHMCLLMFRTPDLAAPAPSFLGGVRREQVASDPR